MKFNEDLAVGPRAPDPTPGLACWTNIEEVRKIGHMLQRKLKFLLIDGDEKDHCTLSLDSALMYAEALIRRQDRNGPKVGNTELEDMQAVLRLAAKNPDQFKMFDVKGLKAAVDKLNPAAKKK